MNRYLFKLPDIGEGIVQSEIAAWHVAVGDAVKEEQPFVDMLTDKAAVELPSPVAGKVIELCGRAGDVCAVGGTLAVIELSNETIVPSAAALTASSTAAPPQVISATSAATRAPTSAEEKPTASPAVRRRARELDVELSELQGTGPSGRVTHEDLDRLVQRRAQPGTTPPERLPSEPAMARTDKVEDDVQKIPIIGVRRKIAEAMQRSKQRIPHFAYVEEVDVTELEALRTHLNSDLQGRARLTFLPFLMKALACAVPSFPSVNARYDDEAGTLHRHRSLHIGIATQTPNGLVVPVVRSSERLDIWAAAAEVARLAAAARDGKARRDELSGSTITITSLGKLGGVVTTPVINAPETAIVGVNRIVERPVIRGGAISARQMMNLSSSFDHRIVDGYEAAQFIQMIKGLLEHPARLFMT